MRNYLRSKGRCWQLKLKVDFNFPDDYHTLFASGNKELNFVISTGYFSNMVHTISMGVGALQNGDEFFYRL